MNGHQDECGIYLSTQCNCERAGQCAPPAAPEMPEGWSWSEAGSLFIGPPRQSLTVDDLRNLLATQGLSICTEAERKVLEACAAFPTEHLTGDAYPSLANKQELSDLGLRWSEAELARREK